MNDKGGIYIILNLVNGKKYIGRTQCFKHRFKYHRTTLRANTHRNIHLQSSWNKYGEDNFRFIEFFRCAKKKLGHWEVFFTNKFKTLNMEFGYNFQIPKENGGFYHTPESRAKIGAASRGKNNPNYGKKMSKKKRKKISETLKGRKLSPEHIAKISGKNNHNYGRTGEKHPMFGKHHRQESCIKASRAWGMKPFAAYKNGSKIGEYLTQAQCGRELGIRQSGVSQCLHGRAHYSNGYTFKFL